MLFAFQSILIILVFFGLLFLFLFKWKVTRQNELYYNLAIAMAATFAGVYLALKVNSYQKDKETTSRLISVLESSQELWKFEVMEYNWSFERFQNQPNHYKYIGVFPRRPFRMFDPLKTILSDAELYQKTSRGFRKYLPISIAQYTDVDSLLKGSSNIDSISIEQNLEEAANIFEYLDSYVKNELQFLKGEKNEDSVNIYYGRLIESRGSLYKKRLENFHKLYDNQIDSLEILLNRVEKELPDSIRISKGLYDKIIHLSMISVIKPDSIMQEILRYNKKDK